MSTAPITLERVPGKSSSWIMQGNVRMGILIPPAASCDPWEVWCGPEWICHRFTTENEALIALGIAAEEEELAAA
jgi:hypothetical protein